MNGIQVMDLLLKNFTAYPDEGEYLFCDKCKKKFPADDWDDMLDHIKTHKEIVA